jgi:uncharacterized membrane protein (UPF0182 family)
MARRTSSPGIFDDPNILLSQYITHESRILFRRNIRKSADDRPFLRLDRDPYMVISEGRLFLDAKTPHHQPLVLVCPTHS